MLPSRPGNVTSSHLSSPTSPEYRERTRNQMANEKPLPWSSLTNSTLYKTGRTSTRMDLPQRRSEMVALVSSSDTLMEMRNFPSPLANTPPTTAQKRKPSAQLQVQSRRTRQELQERWLSSQTPSLYFKHYRTLEQCAPHLHR